MQLDSIPVIVLQFYAPELASDLSKFFSFPIILAYFLLLENLITSSLSLKKGKNLSDPLNYRPIAITSLICKTIETIITKELLAFPEPNNLFLIISMAFNKPDLLVTSCC